MNLIIIIILTNPFDIAAKWKFSTQISVLAPKPEIMSSADKTIIHEKSHKFRPWTHYLGGNKTPNFLVQICISLPKFGDQIHLMTQNKSVSITKKAAKQ